MGPGHLLSGPHLPEHSGFPGACTSCQRSLRSALLFTAALLPGPLVKTSPGITTCGSLSFFPDRFPPTHSPRQHPVPADSQGLRALCQACPPCFMCAPGLVFRLCEVLAESRTPGTLPRHCALTVVWVAQERAGDEERPPCPLLGKQPPTRLPVFGCLNCTQWACGSERKKTITQILKQSLNPLLFLLSVTVIIAELTHRVQGICVLVCPASPIASEISAKALLSTTRPTPRAILILQVQS